MTKMGTTRWITAAAAALLIAAAVHAQECDDFNPCTGNDMCSEGFCTGVFQDTSCDDNDPCTSNDHCQDAPEGGAFCLGDQPGQMDAECAGGCGTCRPLAPIPGAPLACIGEPGNAGQTCDLGTGTPCFEPKCQIFAPLNQALCVPDVKDCPDTDGNLCNDACDFNTGECEGNAIKCDPNCETCNTATGACQPANLGNACDDGNECSPSSRCETIDQIGRTFCLPGEATGPTPTPTVVPGGDCVGDCDDSGEVAINELILGVNISLGSAQISQCLAFDSNDSGAVEINELIGGVNASLAGCA
jgi:hypothetical protein